MTEDLSTRTAIAVIADIRKGALVEELTQKLAELTREVIANNGSGYLSLKLIVKPHGGAENALIISDDVTLKLPKPKKFSTLLFCDEEGSLTREDPLQCSLDLEEEKTNVRRIKG